jgi:Tol biopolymer transport system component
VDGSRLFTLAFAAAVGACSSKGGAAAGGGSIPATSFVFVRAVDATRSHLVAYDTATQAETTLATLDDTGQANDLAIAPDRSKVAFSAVFRAGGETVKGDAKAIWTVGVDGASYVRLTPPIAADPTLTQETIDRASPEWARDGSSVLFVLTTGSRNMTRSTLASVGTGGGAPDADLGANADCQTLASPRFTADGSAMTAILSACASSKSGIAFYDPAPAAPTKRLGGTDTAQGPAVVAPDGATLYFREQLGAHSAIVASPVAGGKPRTIYAPPDANVAGFDLSPDGTQIVAGIGGCTIVVVASLDAAAPTAATVATGAGGSCAPAWH